MSAHFDISPRSGFTTACIVAIFLATTALPSPALGSAEDSKTSKIEVQAAPALSPAAGASEADLNLALSLQNAFVSAASRVLPAVVEVNVSSVVRQPAQDGQPMQPDQIRQGLGSGVIIGQGEGLVYVLTNNHVVQGATDIQLVLYDKREYRAALIGGDPRTDLALLSFSPREAVPIAVLGDSDAIRVGEWVIAVGNPFGFESTVTAGVVSAVNRRAEGGSGIADLTDYIQTDASINSGNSGGALHNLRGEVVGINTWIASGSGGSIGIGFAIPINNARAAVQDFLEYGRVIYGWLGVGLADASPLMLPGVREDLKLGSRTGALATSVFSGSPAEDGGVRPGDFIVSLDGKGISSVQQLGESAARLRPKTRLALGVIREGKEVELELRITERPSASAPPSRAWPGLTLLAINDTIRAQAGFPASVRGLIVLVVESESPAADMGIRPGDIITEIAGKSLESLTDFYGIINAAPKGLIVVRLNRQGREVLGIITK